MSIDDEDAKVRKNLVTYSALVVLASFFEISLLDLINKIGWTTRNIPEWKAITAGLACLVYLLARYRWSKDFLSSMASKQADLYNARAAMRRAYLDSWVKRCINKTTRFFDRKMMPNPDERLESLRLHDVEFLALGYTVYRDFEIKVNQDGYQKQVVGYPKIGVAFVRTYIRDQVLDRKEDLIYIKPKLWIVIVEHFVTKAKYYFYSEGAIGVVVPVFLALIALCCFAVKLMAAYIH